MPGVSEGSRMRIVAATLAVATLLAAALVSSPSSAAAWERAGPAVVDSFPLEFDVHIADREVRATAQVGNRIYAGGNFRWVGPESAGAAGLADTANGAFDEDFPAIDGIVQTAIADRDGGWYLGGSFATVDGRPFANVVHVDRDGDVDAGFDPDVNGPVLALALAPSGGLIIGGQFSSAGGQPARNLMRVDAQDGSRVPWQGTANGRVLALAVAGGDLYAGGEFAFAGGKARRGLAAFDARTGALRPLRADADGAVEDLLLSGNGRLFLAGRFLDVDGLPRPGVAVIALGTGQVTAFRPNPDGPVLDLELSPGGGTLYLGGSFSMIGTVPRMGLAAVDASSGARLGLFVPPLRGEVRTIELDTSGKTMFVGGDFNFRTDGQPDPLKVMASIELPSGELRSWQPPVYAGEGGRPVVNHLELGGGRMLVGGNFEFHGGEWRPYLIAIDLATGKLDRGFDPDPNGAVHALLPAPDGDLYVGGGFTRIGGAIRLRLARIDGATGEVVQSFGDPGVDAVVMKIARHGTQVYVGGGFSEVGGEARAHLARLNGTTGALDQGFDVPVGSTIRALEVTPDGATLFVVGQFSQVDGKPRKLVAAINTGLGRVRTWKTDTYEQRGLGRDVAISPDGSTVYVVTAGGDSPPGADTAVAFPVEGGANVEPLWFNRVGDSIEAVAAAEDAIYIGGHIRHINGFSKERFHIAALDPETGVGLPWNPSSGGFRGVLDLTLAPAGLLVGTDGWQIGSRERGRIAVFAH